MKISQSLLKGLLSYSQGEDCGLVFKAKYIDSRFELFPPSDAMNLGAWFEYMATGSIPKNGAVPQPKTLKIKVVKEPKPKKEKKPKKLKKGEVAIEEPEKEEEQVEVEEVKEVVEVVPELAADYRLMLKHLDNFKNVMEHYGFEIISVGEDISVPYPDSIEKFGFQVTLTGTLDMRVRALRDIIVKDSNGFNVTVAHKGDVVIIDIKVSGLLDNRWEKFGWNLSMLHDKVNLITQPIHYKYIELLNTGINPPFLFLLFDPKDEHDCRLIDFRFDESHFDTHRAFIDKAVPHLLHYKEHGYKARPSLARCAECPLKDECEFKAVVPPIQVYYLQ